MELFRLFGSVFLKDEATDKLDDIDKKAKNTDNTFANLAKGVAVAGAVIGAALGAVGVKAIKSASDAEEMRGKFQVVFGDLENDVRDWAVVTAQAVGRSQIALEGYLAETQNMLVGMGSTREEGAMLSQQIVQLGIDLASFNNLAEADALSSLQSAISGNHNASKALGAVLNENTLAMAMERMQIQGKFQDLDEVTKMQVRYEAVLMQSEDAIGDAVRTSGSFANQMRRLQGTLADVVAEIGEDLLPIATEFLVFLGSQIPMLKDALMPAIRLVIDALSGMLPPIIELISKLAEKLVPVITRLIEALLPVFTTLLVALMPVLDPLIDLFIMLLDVGLIPIIEAIIPLIEQLLPPLAELLAALIPIITPLIEIILKLVNIALGLLINEIIYIVNSILPSLTNALNAIPTIFENVKNKILGIMEAIKNGFKASVNFVVNMLNKFIGSANNIISKLNAVPGVNLPRIPNIPGLAKGGTVTGSGSVLVGERGPELLDLPRGARVTPLDKAGGGINITITGNTLMNDRDADRLGDVIVNRLRVLGVT